MASFAPQMTKVYMDSEGGRESMITTTKAPSLNIAKMAFGTSPLKTIIKGHLYQLSLSMGVTSSPEAVDAISDDIISGYGDLKITEIMLALQMIREGKFRHGRYGEDNRGRMFGVLSSDVICDCINRFACEYRATVIERKENEELQARIKEEESRQATYEQRRDIIMASCMENPASIPLFKNFLKPEDVMTLEYYASERKALCLLKQRVEEYLRKPAEERSTESLEKGCEYINKNFPFDPKSLEVLQTNQQE